MLILSSQKNVCAILCFNVELVLVVHRLLFDCDKKMFTIVGNEITKSFLELEKLSPQDLINSRRKKFEKMGVFKS